MDTSEIVSVIESEVIGKVSNLRAFVHGMDPYYKERLEGEITGLQRAMYLIEHMNLEREPIEVTCDVCQTTKSV